MRRVIGAGVFRVGGIALIGRHSAVIVDVFRGGLIVLAGSIRVLQAINLEPAGLGIDTVLLGDCLCTSRGVDVAPILEWWRQCQSSWESMEGR